MATVVQPLLKPTEEDGGGCPVCGRWEKGGSVDRARHGAVEWGPGDHRMRAAEPGHGRVGRMSRLAWAGLKEQ
jgi:hypothetical protein